MEPFSIATALISLIDTAARLSLSIAAFVSQVHDARKYMDAVSRDEMNKLRFSLEAHKSAIEIALDMVSIYVLHFSPI
jgi:hypothetical protein